MTIPKQYQDIHPSIREELFDAFSTYWEEQSMEDYIRGIHEDDPVTLEELEQEAGEFINAYLYDKLMDET